MLKSNLNGRGRYGYGGSTVDYGDRLGWWERTLFTTATTDRVITISGKYVRRPDLLAYDLYGDATLMWIILQFNSILDISTEFVTGSQITIPSKTRVFSEILKTRQPTLTPE